MSQQRRRRRRRRGRGGGGSQKAAEQKSDQQSQAEKQEGSGRRGRRRRGSSRAGPATTTFKSSEDLVRSFAPAKPTSTSPSISDDVRAEDIIGQLQSEHGVPQYPQEYRITLKVADDRGRKNGAGEDEESGESPRAPAGGEPTGVRREKAPAAPRMPSAQGDRRASGSGSKKKRRRRRGRKDSGTEGQGAGEGS
jgi:hypothetical protein